MRAERPRGDWLHQTTPDGQNTTTPNVAAARSSRRMHEGNWRPSRRTGRRWLTGDVQHLTRLRTARHSYLQKIGRPHCVLGTPLTRRSGPNAKRDQPTPSTRCKRVKTSERSQQAARATLQGPAAAPSSSALLATLICRWASQAASDLLMEHQMWAWAERTDTQTLRQDHIRNALSGLRGHALP